MTAQILPALSASVALVLIVAAVALAVIAHGYLAYRDNQQERAHERKMELDKHMQELEAERQENELKRKNAKLAQELASFDEGDVAEGVGLPEADEELDDSLDDGDGETIASADSVTTRIDADLHLEHREDFTMLVSESSGTEVIVPDKYAAHMDNMPGAADQVLHEAHEIGRKGTRVDLRPHLGEAHEVEMGVQEYGSSPTGQSSWVEDLR